ncbi:DUF397 domain-containing protein [Streptomyces sp. NPDC091377]|uniref:DUF397 domain-containing protein n=1 Tax=Streptomyces sp. NPDC091377 TaxID=3365995 RepID=UPI00380D2C17
MSTAACHWLKSTYSDSSNGNDCVEVAVVSATVHVRDSKVPDAPHFAVARAAWADFVSYAVSDG